MAFLTAAEALPPPEQPLPPVDPYVFGTYAPDRDPVPHAGPYWICYAHPGVSWYGVRDCFVCAPEVTR